MSLSDHGWDHVVVRRDSAVLTVLIDRPERRNSLHPPASDELAAVFDAFFADDGLRVAVLGGVGDQAFCAGDDRHYAASGAPRWLPAGGFGGLTSRRGMDKPVIAAVNGWAVGGGFELVLACHLAVADVTARFALPETRSGRVPGAGGLVRLPRVVGRAVAIEMALTGRHMTATEARAAGVVNRVVPPGTAVASAQHLAAEILGAGTAEVGHSLRIIDECARTPDVDDAVARSRDLLRELRGS